MAEHNTEPKIGTNAAPRIGAVMPDGTIYAGVSPDTHKPMYTTPVDASLTMTFNEAQKYAAKLDAQGHHDWRVPTKAELNMLFNNRAAIHGCDTSVPAPSIWYWSASENGKREGWGQRFSDGLQLNYSKAAHSSVRCLRYGLPKAAP